MGLIESFFLVIGKWFGYVGACMFVPDATCRPFLAFVALGAAACAALTLVVMAYRAAQQREPAQAETEALRKEPAAGMQERPQRRAAEPRITARPAVQTRLRAAA
jgi:hypothetical protein